MGKNANKPFYIAAVPLLAVGCVFAALGASGQEAFGWTAIGLLVPGIVMLITGAMRQRRAA
ncbi:hypothetical protein AHFPHNDE_02446 [Pseudomonas sp. MM227]|uniref:hypothetical protein n=1 Tax=Pseudomonas sp. MM227 TaxID=3019968 RepID=UPI00221F718A|nr:hypothetical protein [Pseudomonas sp. MM227]CAI3788769.1 hypothetical protein AHFPHNDE_02446 [Pseudomonas sp. MM227]